MENTAVATEAQTPVIVQLRLETTGLTAGDFFIGRLNDTPRWRFTLVEKDIARGYVFAKAPVDRLADGSVPVDSTVEWTATQMVRVADGRHLTELNPQALVKKAKITKENPVTLANLKENPNAIMEAWATRNHNRIALQPCITPTTRDQAKAARRQRSNRPGGLA